VIIILASCDTASLSSVMIWFSKVKVKVTLRLMVSQSVSLGVEPHLGHMTRYLFLSDSYGLVLWGALSHERTGLSFVYTAGPFQRVFLGSESLGTREHILLSKIWDFPFRRLLRLAGSRWRYRPPLARYPFCIAWGRIQQKTPLPSL
jgi:hypothetical protein